MKITKYYSKLTRQTFEFSEYEVGEALRSHYKIPTDNGGRMIIEFTDRDDLPVICTVEYETELKEGDSQSTPVQPV